VLVDRSSLYKGKPVKGLTEGLTKSGGRNNYGRVTARFIGGGHKRSYRIVDFKRTKFDMSATVERIEYDPNRTAFIALIKYEDGELSYILAPQRLAVGDKVIAGAAVDVKPGNAMPLQHAGRHDRAQRRAEARQGRPGRSFGRHLCPARRPRPGHGDPAPELGRAAHRPRFLHGHRRCGVQPGPRNVNLGKAGRKVWLGKRPHNRGVAMNPVDHPHGGGEGRTSGGRHPVTPWGKPTKGKKTRSNKSTDKFIMRSRHAQA
jgi:large subunit ribosomal protein L2